LVHLFHLFIYLWMEHCQQFGFNPSILFNFLVNSTANCSPLSNTMLSSNPCNFHILSLNNFYNPFADVPSVIATKCIFFDNLSQTTRIVFFPATNSNFVMKSTVKYVYGTLDTSLNFNFPVSTSVLFFIHWHISHLSTYHPTFLVTPSHQ